MSVEYRPDRKRWGFRIFLHGKRQKHFRWQTKKEAQDAYEAYTKTARLPPTSLVQAATAYLVDSRAKRSRSRYEGIRYNLHKWLLPYYGEACPVGSITPASVESFVAFHRQRGVRNITIWHYVKDLRALLNWCIRQGLLETNPVTKADLSLIRNRKALKLPLDLKAIDLGLSCLKGRELLYANVLRFMGLRKDEGNHVQTQDVIDHGTQVWLRVRGTKTAGSHRVLAVPPVLWQDLREAIKGLGPEDYPLCPNPKERIYDRRKMFQRISKAAQCKVVPKDLRDYFASIMDDPTVASQMLGHTSLRTTAIYVRQVQQRMVQGVANLGTKSGGQYPATIRANPPKTAQRTGVTFRNYLEKLSGRSAAW
jgi:integrase